MVWAQIFPFIGLQFYEGEEQGSITVALVGSFVLWLLLNAVFFCTIDLSYLNTFFGAKTAAQYTSELFLTSQADYQKWDAIFTNRLSYSKDAHEDFKEWVAANVTRWKAEGEDWFNIEMIDDKFLPEGVLEAEGGARRRRSRVSLREIVGLKEQPDESQVSPAP